MWVLPYAFAAVAADEPTRAQARLRALAKALLKLEDKAQTGLFFL